MDILLLSKRHRGSQKQGLHGARFVDDMVIRLALEDSTFQKLRRSAQIE